MIALRRPAPAFACRVVCRGSRIDVCTPRREPAMATAEQIVHVSEFTNEPFIDFTKAENRTRMQEALKKVKAEFGREYPMWLNGKKVTTTEKRNSTNPSQTMGSSGVFRNATAEM